MEKIIDYLYSLDWTNYSNVEYFNYLTNTIEKFSNKKTSIEYSKEELDYFIEKADLRDNEDKLLELYFNSYLVEDIKITANIATKKERFDSLLLTLESIKDQFDEIRIYLNDYDVVPVELQNYSVFLGPDLTDNAKLIWSDNEDEYYFTIDDDVIYPPDYVKNTLPLIGDRIVCYSGRRINTSNLNEYFSNHRKYEVFEKLDSEVEVDIVDTTYMAFNTKYFFSNLWRSPVSSKIDLLLSLEACLHNVPIVCLPHDSNWIRSIHRDGITKEFFNNQEEHIRFLKMISTYKDLKETDLKKEYIFGTINRQSIEKIADDIRSISSQYKNFYHIGSGIGTNLLHLTFLLDFENYIGVNTEEYRTRFAKRTFHGKRKDFKGQINFFKSDLERLMFDESSVILFNPFITQKMISMMWNKIPVNSYLITFDRLLQTKPLISSEVEMVNGEKKLVHFYKKSSGKIDKFEFVNIPFKFEESKDKEGNVIPKIIHHIAPIDRSNWHYKWIDCFESWVEKFPDFEHKMWDDDDIEKFITENYNWYLKIYKSYDRNIKRYDMARILILHHFGGIYADMDYIVYKNFYKEMPTGKISTPISPFRLHEFVQNALFISPKNHVFWLMCLDFSISRTHITSVLDATGPKLVSDCYYEFFPICKNFINLLPSEKFNPSWRTPEFESNDLVTKHLCSNSWTLKVRPGVIWTDDFI